MPLLDLLFGSDSEDVPVGLPHNRPTPGHCEALEAGEDGLRESAGGHRTDPEGTGPGD